MKVKQPAPVRGEKRRRRPKPRQPERNARPRPVDAPPRKRRPDREQRSQRSAPQTGPIPRPAGRPAPPKSSSQAKARAKARKAKAPKVVRPPLRERIITKLASIELSPRRLVARVPFVVLVIGSLGMGLGITLWLSTDSAERSYQLGNAREANEELLQHKEALQRDVLEAQAAPALAEAARGLGMIPSRDTAHLVQNPGGDWVVVGTPKPAEGAPPPPLNTPLPDPTAAPPPPPQPRVVDPRELTTRVPSEGDTAHMPGIAPPTRSPGTPAPPGADSVPLATTPGVHQGLGRGPAPGPTATGPTATGRGPAPGPAQTPAAPPAAPPASATPPTAPSAGPTPPTVPPTSVERFSPVTTSGADGPV